MNRIVSVISGLITSWILISAGEYLLHRQYPLPVGFDPANIGAVVEFVNALPVLAFVLLIIIWAVAAFAGGYVSGKIAKGGWLKICVITGGILLAGHIINLLMIHHPVWVSVISSLLYLPVTILGGRMANKNSVYIVD